MLSFSSSNKNHICTWILRLFSSFVIEFINTTYFYARAYQNIFCISNLLSFGGFFLYFGEIFLLGRLLHLSDFLSCKKTEIFPTRLTQFGADQSALSPLSWPITERLWLTHKIMTHNLNSWFLTVLQVISCNSDQFEDQ